MPTRRAAAASPASRDTSIATYRAKRDFTRTREPPPGAVPAASTAPVFVVQRHDATRLHYDFRLEHDGVLWSWAIPRGPSLDPHDKRLAVHVEDHPLDYAGFEGSIPKGEYGGGTVEIWDRGTWSALSEAPAADLARGEMKFELTGSRLQGRFVLIRLKPRPKEHAENWLLIKEHDEHEREGADVDQLVSIPLAPLPEPRSATRAVTQPNAPIKGAKRAPLPETQAPQLASAVDEPPQDGQWVSEIKLDGYRMLVFKDGETVRLITRNGLDWTHRLRGVAALFAKAAPATFLLDGELVSLRPDGVSSFPDLQAALSAGRDDGLVFYAFDLLHLGGWDLRPCPLLNRKTALQALPLWTDRLRYSDHIEGDAGPVRRQACSMGLEGIIAKRADTAYRAGRSRDWVKLKCQGREEFVVVGWTPPAGARSGIGALHLGFYDAMGALHYVGAVGTGFDDKELTALRTRLDTMAIPPPDDLLLTAEKPDRKVTWVRPELVAEVQFTGWSGAGRVRHAVYLGLREDKAATEVVMAIPDPDAPRAKLRSTRANVVTARAPAKVPKSTPPTATAAPVAQPDGAAAPTLKLTHPDRELWPGITKQMLADYWAAVAGAALPGIAHRPLALVRCVDGVAGQQFFQKHAMKGMQRAWAEGEQDGAPYLFCQDAEGLRAAAQMAAIELHSWGSALPDAAHADRLVFDLDPGPGVDWATTIQTAIDLRDRLAKTGLAAFCRTSGGKGLHVVVPVTAGPDWDSVRAWCRAYAEAMEAEAPDRYVASVPKVRRTGRILIDWLRNGLGSTAIASFSPRARAGAPVATPVTWREVTPKLDPAAFTVLTLPKRLAKLKADPWEGFAVAAKPIPLNPLAPKRKR